MNDKESSESSFASESSPSEGEYLLSESESPKFDFSCWDPVTSVQYLGLLPVTASFTYEQIESVGHGFVGKMKTSAQHRRNRLREFNTGVTIGKNIYDEKRLRRAVSENDYKTVEELLDSGVDPCCMDDKRRTPLHLSASKGYSDIVSLLLDRGADPNQKDIIGNTALHLAACTNHIPVITLLLRGGTKVNVTDHSGRTPLHLAHSRLRLLKEDIFTTSETLKQDVTQVVLMMKEYLMKSGPHQDKDISQLDLLCNRLHNTDMKEEIYEVSELLSDFTNLTLQKNQTTG
eukprot:GHVU01101250.1.p1 GENE.GHVU01101250.1~~GHVU01101250.1.p1  ORF type:complete len:307 (-),score=36.67 GHVU01101250.1:552-1418(-)